MKMVHNLIIILLIIGFSYLFETSCNYEFNQQLTFILLSLFVIIIYKFLINKCIAKENFNDFTTQINEFLKGGLPDSKTSTEDMKEYSKQLVSLQDKVDIMNEYLNEIKETAERKGEGETMGNQLNIQASQQIQDYRIREMQKEISRTTDLIKEAKMREDSTKFKKIPIYSSCVISNADGSMQVDTPSTDRTGENSVSTQQVVSGSVLPGNRNTQVLRNANNIGDNKPSGSDKVALQGNNVNASNNQIGNMIKSVLEKGVNLNINV
jgi:hypothetical protein